MVLTELTDLVFGFMFGGVVGCGSERTLLCFAFAVAPLCLLVIDSLGMHKSSFSLDSWRLQRFFRLFSFSVWKVSTFVTPGARCSLLYFILFYLLLFFFCNIRYHCHHHHRHSWFVHLKHV